MSFNLALQTLIMKTKSPHETEFHFDFLHTKSYNKNDLIANFHMVFKTIQYLPFTTRKIQSNLRVS